MQSPKYGRARVRVYSCASVRARHGPINWSKAKTLALVILSPDFLL